MTEKSLTDLLTESAVLIRTLHDENVLLREAQEARTRWTDRDALQWWGKQANDTMMQLRITQRAVRDALVFLTAVTDCLDDSPGADARAACRTVIETLRDSQEAPPLTHGRLAAVPDEELD